LGHLGLLWKTFTFYLLYCSINVTISILYSDFNFGSEAWVLKKRDEQRLEAAQMSFLRHLLGITKLDKVKN
jgi:hypothetical protein